MPLDDAEMTFGQLLADGMRRKKLDYRTLAKLVGVSHGYLWQLVNAEKRALNDPTAKQKRPSPAVTRQIASALELDVATLLRAAGAADAAAEPLPSGPTRYTTFVPNARQLYQDGLEASAKGQAERAVALLEAAVDAGARGGGVSFVNAHAGLGMAHYQAGRYALAISEFDAALAALSAEPETRPSISEADLYYNRGLAYQRQARSASADERPRLQRAAARDFMRAIALEGDRQDLYHAALCYLLLERDRPHRVVPYARAFLRRQAIGPPRYTTAALDVSLFLAFAHAALGEPSFGLEIADLTLQLCPEYWYAHFVKAALLARSTIGAARRRAASRQAGLLHARRAIALHPEARAHFQRELAGDFAAWADDADFNRLLSEEETP